MPASLSDLPLIDPEVLHATCVEQGLPTDSWWGMANSFECPLVRDRKGQTHGTAKLLMLPEHYDRIEDANDLTLKFDDGNGHSVEIGPLCLVGLENVLPGPRDDSASAYLLELADRRYLMSQVAVSRSYNTLNPDGSYVADSLNSGIAWTWTTLVADLWSKIVAVVDGVDATPPALPASATNTPQGFYFYKEDAWTALCRVAEAMASFCRYDPVDDEVTFVRAEPSSTPAFITASDESRLIWSSDIAVEQEERWPEFLVVSFPRMGYNDRHQVSGSVSETNDQPGSSVVVWDDLPSVGDPSVNDTAVAQRAAQVLEMWKWSFRAEWVQDVQEYQGWVDNVRLNLGYSQQTAWGISDRHGGWFNGGVITSACSTPPFVNRDMVAQPGELAASGRTTDVTVVTNVCPVVVASVLTGDVIVEKRVIRVPDSWLISGPVCETSPEDCCLSTWWCLEGVCTEVASGDTPAEGSTGPFETEAACDEAAVARWYCVGGACVEYAACEPAPEGGYGPYTSESECTDAGCPPGGIDTDCGTYPSVMVGRFTARTGYALFFTTSPVLFVWNGINGWEYDTGLDCGSGQNQLTIQCDGGSAANMELSSGVGNIGPIGQAPDGGATSSPTNLVYTVTGTFGCGAMSYVLTVTDT